jgi:hypothetical protein
LTSGFATGFVVVLAEALAGVPSVFLTAAFGAAFSAFFAGALVSAFATGFAFGSATVPAFFAVAFAAGVVLVLEAGMILVSFFDDPPVVFGFGSAAGLLTAGFFSTGFVAGFETCLGFSATSGFTCATGVGSAL